MTFNKAKDLQASVMAQKESRFVSPVRASVDQLTVKIGKKKKRPSVRKP